MKIISQLLGSWSSWKYCLYWWFRSYSWIRVLFWIVLFSINIKRSYLIVLRCHLSFWYVPILNIVHWNKWALWSLLNFISRTKWLFYIGFSFTEVSQICKFNFIILYNILIMYVFINREWLFWMLCFSYPSWGGINTN